MSVSRGQSTPAVVLRTRAIGESDLVVVLMTATLGKVATAAAAARRSRRRFPGGLPAGAVGEATGDPRPRRALMRLESFAPARDHGVLGRDLERFAYVAYVCELTDELVLEHEPDPRLFGRVQGTVVRLCEEPPDPLVLRRFELGLLGDLGHLPALGACCVCGRAIEEAAPVGFDAGRGGALCPAHRGGAPGVSGAALRVARALLGGAQEQEQVAEAPGPVRQEVRDLVLRVLRLHLRRPLRSAEFFRALPAVARRG